MVAVYFDQVIEKQKQNITRGVKQKKITKNTFGLSWWPIQKEIKAFHHVD